MGSRTKVMPRPPPRGRLRHSLTGSIHLPGVLQPRSLVRGTTMSTKVTNPDPWLTPAQAADWAGLSHKTLRRAISSGALIATRIGDGRGSTLRVRTSAVEAWMRAGTTA